MLAYYAFDPAKAIDAADRVLQLDPNNMRALYAEALIREAAAEFDHRPSGQAGCAGFRGRLRAEGVWPRPSRPYMSDADFKTLQTTCIPRFTA